MARNTKTINFDTNRVMNILDWFQTGVDFQLGFLMQERRFLAVQSFALADLVGLAHREFISYEVQRKRVFANLRDRYVKAGAKSIADAQRQAEVEPEYEQVYKAEKDAEARYEHGNNLLRALNRVLDAMGQEIAELRYEKKMPTDEQTDEKIYGSKHYFPQKEPAN